LAKDIEYRGERWIMVPGIALSAWGIVSGYALATERTGLVDLRDTVGLEVPEGMHGWALVVASTLLAVYCLWHFIAPMKVAIDDTGVIVRSPLYRRHFLWMEIERLEDATWFHVRLVLTPEARRRKGVWGFSPVLPRPPAPIQREFLSRIHAIIGGRPDPMGFV
jgi:hypothetical protein